jgi:hypothetical protein
MCASQHPARSPRRSPKVFDNRPQRCLDRDGFAGRRITRNAHRSVWHLQVLANALLAARDRAKTVLSASATLAMSRWRAAA